MEELILALLILAGVVFVIWIWYLICREFYRIAEHKGFPQDKYLWLTFFLGLIGMLLVIGLPDRGVQKATMLNTPAAPQAAVVSDELPDL